MLCVIRSKRFTLRPVPGYWSSYALLIPSRCAGANKRSKNESAVGRNRVIALARRQAPADGVGRQEWRNKGIAPYGRQIESRRGASADAQLRSRHAPAQLVVDVKPDDVVEVAFDELESQLSGPCGVEVARPTLDDTRDDRIGCAPDPLHDAITGDATQRRDLLGDRDRQSRHREVTPIREVAGVDGCGVDQEADRRARR